MSKQSLRTPGLVPPFTEAMFYQAEIAINSYIDKLQQYANGCDDDEDEKEFQRRIESCNGALKFMWNRLEWQNSSKE